MRGNSAKKKSSKISPTEPKRKLHFTTEEETDKIITTPSSVPIDTTKTEPLQETDKIKQKIENLFKGVEDSSKYDFNLYKHLKENIKYKDKQCKDGLNKESSYCINCKLSTCPNCPNFQTHNNHTLIQKYLYYICD